MATADCGLIVRGGDGCDYAVKDGISKGSAPEVPHSEWFCTQLGEAVGIAGPGHKVLRMPDGTEVFGSRWEGGVSSPAGAAKWWNRVKEGTIKLDDFRAALSRIYAFDQFIHNVDRHADNFLVRDQHEGFALLANDYSRAWIRHGFPLPALPLANCNTVNAQRHLTAFWGEKYIDPAVVDEVISKLKTIPVNFVKRIIEDSPDNWLSQKTKDDILAWWGSPEMVARLDGISEGVKNGTYL